MAESVFERSLLTAGDIFEFWTSSDQEAGETVSLSSKITVGNTGPSLSFVITKLEIGIYKEGTVVDDLVVELRDWDATNNQPGQRVLATKTIALADVGTTRAYLDCEDMDKLTLHSGESYAIVVHGGVQSDGNQYIAVEGAAGGLRLQFSQNTQGFTWDSSSSVATFPYKITGTYWGSENIEYNELVNLCGTGVNSTAAAVETARGYLENIEGFVVAVTKYDWIENWDSLTTRAKNIIKNVIMNYTAVNMVNYDVSGYDSRFEAERIALTLQALGDRAIEALLDTNVQGFVKNG